MPGSWVQDALAINVAAPDHLPTCPDCSDLAHPSATKCESCGSPLLPTGFTRAKEFPARPRCTCGGRGICTLCVISEYEDGE